MTNDHTNYDDHADETIEPTLDPHLNPASHAIPGGVMIPPEITPDLNPQNLAALASALDNAIPLMKQGSTYLNFLESGVEVRALFRGMSTYTKEDGTVVPKAMFASHDKATNTWSQWHHSGAVLVRQVQDLPFDTPLSIKYTGSKKHTTKSGATIKLYEVTVLSAPALKANEPKAAWDAQRIAKARAYLNPLTGNEKGGLARATLGADGKIEKLEDLDNDQLIGFRRGCSAIFEALVVSGKDEAAGKISGALEDDLTLLVASLAGLDVIEKAITDTAPPF